MIKNFAAVSAFAIAASMAAPAMAQDDGLAFDGPYIAGMVGYDKVRIETPNSGTGSDDGLLYGGVIGFDKNINGVVLGIEGEYSDSNVRETASSVLVAGDSASLETARDLYAGVRLGGEITPGVLLYVKGGYTNARVRASYTAGGTTVTGRDNLEGYRLGAGVETTVAGFLGRVEYRFSDYGNYENTGLSPERHQVAVMVGYRF